MFHKIFSFCPRDFEIDLIGAVVSIRYMGFFKKNPQFLSKVALLNLCHKLRDFVGNKSIEKCVAHVCVYLVVTWGCQLGRPDSIWYVALHYATPEFSLNFVILASHVSYKFI